MYIGSYNHNLDSKNRLSIPKKWQTTIGKSLIITSGLDGSLFVYDKKSWEIILKNINNLSFLDKDSRNFSRFLLANAFEVDIDTHGRILISENLKLLAKLNIEIILVGVGDRIEIWDKDIFNTQMSFVNSEADDLAKRIYEMNKD